MEPSPHEAEARRFLLLAAVWLCAHGLRDSPDGFLEDALLLS